MTNRHAVPAAEGGAWVRMGVQSDLGGAAGEGCVCGRGSSAGSADAVQPGWIAPGGIHRAMYLHLFGRMPPGAIQPGCIELDR